MFCSLYTAGSDSRKQEAASKINHRTASVEPTTRIKRIRESGCYLRDPEIYSDEMGGADSGGRRESATCSKA